VGKKRNFLSKREWLLVFLIFFSRALFEQEPGWDQNARLAAAFAFVEPGTPHSGTFQIDQLYPYRSGHRLSTGDWSEYQGHYYSNKAPGSSFLAVIPYFLLYRTETLLGLDPVQDRGVFIFNVFFLRLLILALFTSLTVIYLVRKLPELGLPCSRYPFTVAVVYAFGILTFPYESSYWGHTAAANFVLLGTLQLFSRKRESSLWSGVFLGAAALTEYTAIVTLVLGAFFLFRRKDRKRAFQSFVAGALPSVLLLMIYQKVCFGSFFTLAPQLTNSLLIGNNSQFTLPQWHAFVSNLLSLRRGIFLQMPVLFFSVVGALQLYRSGKRWLFIYLVGAFVLTNLILSCYFLWDAGWSTSARYLIVALPFLVLLMPNLSKFCYRKIFYAALSLSVFNMLAVSATNAENKTENPLYGESYRQFFSGRIALSPPARQISSGIRRIFSD
jgi:hypothetical protein